MNAVTYLRPSIIAFSLAISFSAAAQNAITTRPADVRAGPDSSYPVVAELDSDTPVQVMGCLDDWSWCDVGFGDDRGWLYSPDLTYEYQGGYVPLYSYAPALGITVVTFSVDSYWNSHYHNRPFYAQREEWVRRGPPHHERPPGPAPSSSPPPREAVASRPGSDSEHGRSMRLSSADQAHRDSAGHQDQRAGTARPPESRPEQHPAAAAPRAEVQRADASRTPAAPRPSAHTESQSRPAERAAPPRKEEQQSRPAQRPAARPEEHPAEPPHKEERGEHQG